MKKKLLSVALATTMIFSSVVPVTAETVTRTYDEGLTGYYTFDDTLANSMSETGVAKLHGGAGDNWNNGPTIDSATYAEGKNGKAYSFAGDVDDTTGRGDGLELDVKSTANFSVGMWVNTSEKINFQPIFFLAKDFSNYVNVATYFNDYASGGLVMKDDWAGQVIWLDKNDDNKVATITDLALNTWTYVVFTCSSEGVVSLYYDGKLLAENQVTDYDSLYTDQYLFLGINFWNDSFKGLMDDVVVYDKALSAAEVASLYERDGKPYEEETANIATVGVQKNSAGDKMAFITRIDIDTFENEEITDAGVLIAKGEVSSLTIADVDDANVFKCPTPYVTSDTDAGADEGNYAFRTIVKYPDDVDDSTVFTAVPYMVVNGDTVYGDACSMSLADAQ